MELLVRLILCRDGLFIAGMWPSVVNLKLGDTFLVPSEWCMTELEPEISAELSIGEKSGLEIRETEFRAVRRVEVAPRTQATSRLCPSASWPFRITPALTKARAETTRLFGWMKSSHSRWARCRGRG